MQKLITNRLSGTIDSFKEFYDAAAIHGVYLFGAGFIGAWAAGYLKDLGFNVRGFVDSNPAKWGTDISGVKVFPQSDSEVENAKAILICSRHFVPSVRKALDHLPAKTFSIDAFVVHQQGVLGIEKIESLLSNDLHSLETFSGIILSMLDGNTQPLARYADNRPFFDRFGFFNRDDEIFVDAGAYVGDSVERFIWSVNGVFKQIHAFEPGKTQYEALTRRMHRLTSEWALPLEKISLINKGVSDESRMVQVLFGGGLTQTKINSAERVYEAKAEQDEMVDVTTLDKYFDGERFSLLKVDIEGSELALLNGATQSIQAFRPRIALSVYHFPTDIFELPLKCATINPDYEFTLGHHSSKLMESVLYCKDVNE